MVIITQSMYMSIVMRPDPCLKHLSGELKMGSDLYLNYEFELKAKKRKAKKKLELKLN